MDFPQNAWWACDKADSTGPRAKAGRCVRCPESLDPPGERIGTVPSGRHSPTALGHHHDAMRRGDDVTHALHLRAFSPPPATTGSAMDATYYGWHTRGGHVHEPGLVSRPCGARRGVSAGGTVNRGRRRCVDAPGDLDALLNGADAQPPRSSARALGYGTLAIALVVVITGLAAATGASFGRGTPLPLAAQPRGMSDGSGRPVATSPAPTAPAEPSSPLRRRPTRLPPRPPESVLLRFGCSRTRVRWGAS